ncbi:hypothetical protein ES705_50867 [subsurface metagenome]
MPGKLSAGHHSITDWDFERPDTDYSLSPLEFVSPPTSLRLFISDMSVRCTFLCRIPETLCLPQGEIRTWILNPYASVRVACFRNQAPLGTSHPHDCYYLILSFDKAYFYYYWGGISQLISQQACPYPVGEWVHWRVFWYNGKTPGDVDALCVDLYREIAGEWEKQGATFYHTANLWADSEINRCGFLHYIRAGDAVYYDDTEIWGPV